MSTNAARQDYEQLSLIEPMVLPAQDKEKSVSYYSYKEIKERIQSIVEKHDQEIKQSMPVIQQRQIPEQARTIFGRYLEKRQRDALGLSLEIRSLTKELVEKNTMVAFYLRYVEDKKLFLALGYRSFKDYAVNYFNDLEYSYLTRLKKISYMSPQEIKAFEPLGTTKMMHLAQLNPEQRKGILDKEFAVHENEFKRVEDMTTRELGKVVHKEKNPSYRDNLIKGVPSQLSHQLRMLQEHMDEYELHVLVKTREQLRTVLDQLDEVLNLKG